MSYGSPKGEYIKPRNHLNKTGLRNSIHQTIRDFEFEYCLEVWTLSWVMFIFVIKIDVIDL